MWPLFVGIGVGFLLLLSYGWGLSTGVKLGKKTQAREQEAFRLLAERALAAHLRERGAWQRAVREPAQSAQPDAKSSVRDRANQGNEPARPTESELAAELAHTQTREAFLSLAPAWGDFGLQESSKNAGNL